jgi:hypothetical protein
MSHEVSDLSNLENRLNARLAAYESLIERQNAEISQLKWALQTSLEGDVKPEPLGSTSSKPTSRRSALKLMALAGLGVGALSTISAVGTATPTAFAQADKDTNSDPVTPNPPPLATPNTRYITYSGVEFRPRGSATEFTSEGNNAISRSVGSDFFVCPVHLPNGAKITEVVFYYEDTDGTDLSFILRRFNHSEDTFTNLGNVNSTGNTAGVKVATIATLTNNVVDNDTFQYSLVLESSVTNSNHILLGARVGYTEKMELIVGREDNVTNAPTRAYYSGAVSTNALFVFEDSNVYTNASSAYPAALAGWATGNSTYGMYAYTEVNNAASIVGWGVNDSYGGLFRSDFAQVRLQPGSSSGAPIIGTHQRGELFADSVGRLYFCTANGTPGTWVQLTGSAFNFLTSPVRVAASTNSGGTLALLSSNGNTANPDSTAQIIQITGTDVPAGARAIVCSLTSVGATKSGNLRIYPDGATAPTVNTLNIPANPASPTGAGFNLTTAATVALSTAGKVKLAYNNATSGSTCGFSIDVVAYLI